MQAQRHPLPSTGQRRFGAVNWLGLWTLVVREITRFLKFWLQSVLAPVITSLMFVGVFTLAFSHRAPQFGGVEFVAFLTPGMIMMAVIQNSFANSSSSILHSKIIGDIFDSLTPPLSATELTIGYTAGGIARGVLVAIATAAALVPLAGIEIRHPLWMAYFLVAGTCLLSAAGIIAGLWAEKFDHMATITNFVVTPLSFLSGTFYSVSVLPEPWRELSNWNPLFYLIDGFRFGMLGVSDADPRTGLAATLVATALTWGLAWWLFRIGYRIKQ